MVKKDIGVGNRCQEEPLGEESQQQQENETTEKMIKEIELITRSVNNLDKKLATKEDWEKAFNLDNKTATQKDKDSHPFLTKVKYLAMMLVIFSSFFLVSLVLFDTYTSLWISIPLYLFNLFGWSAFIEELFKK